MPKITKRFIEDLIPDSQKTLIFWDTELKGFGVILLPSGRRTYCFQYRNTSRVQKRFKIGIHGSIMPEEARVIAKTYLSQVIQGEDPSEQKKERRSLPSFSELATDYIEMHGQKKRPKPLQNDKSILKNILLPYFKDKKVAHITRREVETLHLNLKKISYRANRTLSLLSRMFNCAIAWEWCSENPVKGIDRYYEEKRDRWLKEDELRRFWSAVNASQNRTAFLFKLLLLTGARKGELLNATWDQFDLEEGTWGKPFRITKQKKKEHLPLSKQALGILKELQSSSTSSPFLFPGRVPGKPLQEPKREWKTLMQKAQIEDFRIHDLRHTHASYLVSDGLSLSIVGKLLGHTQASTTHRYAHLADAPLRKAANIFGERLLEIVSP